MLGSSSSPALAADRARPKTRDNRHRIMLDTLTLESFTPHVGGSFRLTTAGLPELTLTLDEARSLASPATAAERKRPRREPFRLLFRGPSLPILPQRIYAIEHAQLGRLEVFIVPVAPGEYEAIFT
jgi:hypothetical protein